MGFFRGFPSHSWSFGDLVGMPETIVFPLFSYWALILQRSFPIFFFSNTAYLRDHWVSLRLAKWQYQWKISTHTEFGLKEGLLGHIFS